MRSESSTSNSSSSSNSVSPNSASSRSSSRPGKVHDTHDHEAMQRFRKLMDGSTSGKRGGSEADDLTVVSGTDKKLTFEQEKALRDLLQRQLDAADGNAAVFERGDSEGDQDGESGEKQNNGEAGGSLGVQIQQLAVQLAHYSAQQPGTAASSTFTPALAELIERHVKQLLVPDATSRSSAHSREIMITLKGGLLPDTDLWLSRTAKGWRLRADTRSPEAYRSLVDGAPQLIERFANGKLGELEVDPALLG